MRIVIEIRDSPTHGPDCWDLQIDKGGWDCGLDIDQIEMEVSRHTVATVELMERAREVKR